MDDRLDVVPEYVWELSTVESPEHEHHEEHHSTDGEGVLVVHSGTPYSHT